MYIDQIVWIAIDVYEITIEIAIEAIDEQSEYSHRSCRNCSSKSVVSKPETTVQLKALLVPAGAYNSNVMLLLLAPYLDTGTVLAVVSITHLAIRLCDRMWAECVPISG